MNDLLYSFLSFITSLVIALYTVPVVLRMTSVLKMYDNPNERSSATVAVPTLGGIAIFFGFIIAATIGMDSYVFPKLINVFVAILLMFFVGMKDDILNISPYKKISAQLITAAILIFYADIHFTNLHGFLGIGELSVVEGVVLTGFVMIVFINAYNLIDGIDGLAAGLGIFASIVFGSWFFMSGHFEYAILSFSLTGALAGFFFYNVYGKKNKIFMGDTGSLVLGTIISIIVIKFNEFNVDGSSIYSIKSAPAVSFAILIYPLFDTIRVFVIRIVNRRSPFLPDKNHFHHRLLALGFSHKQATYVILMSSIIFIIPVFAMQEIGILKLMVFNLLLCSFLFTLPAIIIQKKKLIKKNDPHQQILFPSNSSKILDHINFIDQDEMSPSLPVEIREVDQNKINFW